MLRTSTTNYGADAGWSYQWRTPWHCGV